MRFSEIKDKIKNLSQFRTLKQIRDVGLRIARNAVTGEYWLIEDEFLKPVIKSPRECRSIMVRPEDLKYKIFMCHKDKKELKGANVLKYIEWGEKQGFHERPSCKSRKRWWDLGGRGKARLNFNYLINDVGHTYVGEVIVSDNFHEIHTEQNPALFLNSTVFWLFQNLYGRTSFGGGLLKIQTYELKQIFALEAYKSNLSALMRAPKSVFEESGINPNKPIRLQVPNPLPDRKALDDIVFDILGLTQDERNEVYWAVCELVRNRLHKAKSLT